MEKVTAVYLEWVDSAGFAEWRTQDEIDELVPYVVRTVGLLVKETEDCLIVAVAETVDMGESSFQKCYNGIMSIPIAAISARYNIDLTVQDADEDEKVFAESDHTTWLCDRR